MLQVTAFCASSSPTVRNPERAIDRTMDGIYTYIWRLALLLETLFSQCLCAVND